MRPRRVVDTIYFANMTILLLPLLLLCWPQFARGLQELGSGCQDFQETADLCMDSSGSGDVHLEVPGESTLRSICRSANLVTWVPDSATGDGTAYMMVQDCLTLETTGESTVSRCEVEQHNINIDEMSLLLPVTSVTTNLTYFNHYCFLCSGDPGPEVTWSINVSCTQWVELETLGTEKEVLQTALESGHCSMTLQPQAESVAEKCEYQGLGSVDGTASLPPPEKPQRFRPLPLGAPLSLLLHFRDTDPPPGGGSDEEGLGGEEEGGGSSSSAVNGNCSSLELQALVNNRCVALHCTPGKRLEGRTCQPVISRSRGLQYALTVRMEVFVDRDDVAGELTSQSLSSLCSLEELIRAGVSQRMTRLHSEAYNLTGWIISGYKATEPPAPLDVPNENVNDLYFEENAAASQYENASLEVGEAAKEIWIGRVLVWFDFIVTSDADRNSVEQEALSMSEEEWRVVCGNTHALLVPTLEDRRDYHDMTDMGSTQNVVTFSDVFTDTEIHEDYRNFWKNRNSAPITISPFLLCPFLIFLHDEYALEDSVAQEGNERTLNMTLLNATALVPAAAVDTDDAGNLKICRSLLVEKFGRLLKVKHGPRRYSGLFSFLVLLEHYLSLVCVCLSLCCLLLTLLTYAMFRSLRTIPGQNTMALCANLFLAQSLLQFGVSWTELKGGCVAIGMLIHYFWLASVLWMNVCSFHMHRVFTARRAARMTSTHVKCCTLRVVAYAVYSQGVPLVAVGATAATSILLSEGRQLGYGGNACYLSSAFLVGVAFAAPLGVVLILNLVFFLGAVREIVRTEKPMQESSLNGHRSPSPNISQVTPFPSTWRRNLNVCIRLSSLTGLFWTLGLIAELLDLRALRLLSALVNGSQGVLIAASYLPTRRVARLYSQACCTCRGKKRQQSASFTPQGSAPGGTTLTVSLASSAVSASGETNGRLHTSEL